MRIHIDRLPIMITPAINFVLSVGAAGLSWFSYHGSSAQLAISSAISNNFIETTQPYISYLGTVFGCLSAMVAFALGCWNLKKRIVTRQA